MILSFQLQDDSIDPSTFAVNRPESSDNESDPGTYEEQRIKNIAARKAKFDELQLKVGLSQKVFNSSIGSLYDVSFQQKFRKWQ